MTIIVVIYFVPLVGFSFLAPLVAEKQPSVAKKPKHSFVRKLYHYSTSVRSRASVKLVRVLYARPLVPITDRISSS